MNENTSLSVVSVTVRGSENIGLKDICYIDGKCPEQFGNTNSVIYADKYGPGFIFAFFEMSVAGSYAPELRSLIGMRMRMLHRSTDFAHSTGEGILNDINATINREIDKYCEYEKLQPGSISIFSKCIMVITGAKVYIDRTGDAGTYYFCTSERRILAKNRESFDLHRGDCFMICSSAVKKSMTPADLQKCLDSNKSAENNVSIVLGEASARDKIHDLTAITIKILNANVPNNSNTGFYQAVGAHSASQKGAVSRVSEDTLPQQILQDVEESPELEAQSTDTIVVPVVDKPAEQDTDSVTVEEIPQDATEATVTQDTIVMSEISEETAANDKAFGDRNTFVFDFKDIDKATNPVPTIAMEDTTPKATAKVPEIEEPQSYYDDSMQTQLTEFEDNSAEIVAEDNLFGDDNDEKEQKSEKMITIVLGVLAGIAMLACLLIVLFRLGILGGNKIEPTPSPTVPVITNVPTPAPTEVPTPEPTEVPTEVPTPEPTEVPTPTPTPSPEELGYRMYTVKEGDTFWGIAYRELGNGDRWPEIASLNGMQNQALTPGTELKLPLQ